MSGKTVLITGANGFSGQHACRYFATIGMKVIGVVRRNGTDELPCETRSCELTDRLAVRSLLEEVAPDYVLHLAGRNSVPESWKDPVSFIETNVLATVYLLDAIRMTSPGARTLVVGSMAQYSQTVRSSPPHPYSFSKMLQVASAQSWADLFGQRVMICHPSNLIGPGPSSGICGLLGRKVAQLERGGEPSPFRLSSLTEQRDFLDVRDAAAAYAAILLQGDCGESYPIGSGIFRTLGDVVRSFQSSARCDVPVDVSKEPVPTYPEPVDVAKVNELGWQARVPFAQSVADILDYFRGSPSWRLK